MDSYKHGIKNLLVGERNCPLFIIYMYLCCPFSGISDLICHTKIPSFGAAFLHNLRLLSFLSAFNYIRSSSSEFMEYNYGATNMGIGMILQKLLTYFLDFKVSGY